MATPATPTVQRMTPTRPPVGVFGSYSSILVVSSQRPFRAGRRRIRRLRAGDEELLDRAAGVRLPRPGHSESPLGRIHPTRPTLLRHWYRLRDRLTGGPESVLYGCEAERTN